MPFLGIRLPKNAYPQSRFYQAIKIIFSTIELRSPLDLPRSVPNMYINLAGSGQA